jgi:dTDP-4-amino-4,6-dideoxygalactose transaminase
MIPRYGPNYSYADLVSSLVKSYRDPEYEKLGARLAELHQVKHVFLFNNAREALFAILRAYNKPGGVLLPAYNSIVVPDTVRFAGYDPVFADIEYNSFNMNASEVKKAMRPGVTAVLLLHQFGLPCKVDEILEVLKPYPVLTIEDVAPAFGAEYHGQRVGNLCDVGILSFRSTKVISGVTGGALVTNNDELAQKIIPLMQEVKDPGDRWKRFATAMIKKITTRAGIYPAVKSVYRLLKKELMFEVVQRRVEAPGYHMKQLSPFTSVLVMKELDKLEWNLSRRRRLAQFYREGLADQKKLRLPDIPDDCAPAWIQFPILPDDRQVFYKYMQRNGIDLSWTFRYSCAESYAVNDCPNAYRAARLVLGLPTYPSLTDQEAQTICEKGQKYR